MTSGLKVGDTFTFEGVRVRSWWRRLLGLRAAPRAPLQQFVVSSATDALVLFDRAPGK